MRRKTQRLGRNTRYVTIPISSSGKLLTPSQQAKRQKELEREKKNKEVQELRRLGVCFDLHPFRENAALTLS